MGVPSIIDVDGAFRWASPGDVALVDADHGLLVINPSRAEVASVRAERREERQKHQIGATPGPVDEEGDTLPGVDLGLESLTRLHAGRAPTNGV
jgi:phosphotransferase system enzyme I (PtsP)